MKKGRPRNCRPLHSFPPVESEDIPDTKHYATVSTIRAPLVQKVGGVGASFRNAEVACVGSIVELCTELKPLVLTNRRVLEDTKVDVVNTVGT
jgi:hypothetical protein